MENSTESKTKLFKGAGYLIGFASGTVIAIVFVAITGVEALIGAISGAVAIPVGISLEKKFQGKEFENQSKGHNFLFVFISVGVIFLVALFLVNYC